MLSLRRLTPARRQFVRAISTGLSTEGPLKCALSGKALLNAPAFNKGSAFTHQERRDFGLEGLLPDAVHTLEDQIERAHHQYNSLPSNLLKNTFMTSMHDQNQVLFYALFERYLKRMMPIVYTPTTGDAISSYSRLFRRPEGCFLTVEDSADDIDVKLAQYGGAEDVDYIVCSDGEAILGIGDQGVGGIGISTAKLALMTLCGGLHPSKALPIVLDVGTDNQSLLHDELYLGLRRERTRGQKYDDFLDRFVKAVQHRFPKALLHFEDFGTSNARKLLDRYRGDMLCFNDDSQGTSAVVLAALTAGSWVTKQDLHQQKVVIFGAGTAGIGIADRIKEAMQSEGLSEKEALGQIFLIDRPGLLLESHDVSPYQKPYIKQDATFEEDKDKDGRVNLLATVRKVKPDVLLGVSGQRGSFTKEVIEEMSKHGKRPIVLPLSNPTSLIEASPEDINTWSNGKALIATGSPFQPVEHDGKRYEIGESNNALVYPGLGYGAVLARASRMSDGMIIAGAKALASRAPALQDPDLALLPDIKYVRETSTHVAAAVIKKAVEEGLANTKDIPVHNDDVLLEWVTKQQWKPVYRTLERVPLEGATSQQKGATGIGALTLDAANREFL
ncbi:NAD-dependent malic enzyme, mitochondrial [Savitreella phatthalungensis]